MLTRLSLVHRKHPFEVNWDVYLGVLEVAGQQTEDHLQVCEHFLKDKIKDSVWFLISGPVLSSLEQDLYG